VHCLLVQIPLLFAPAPGCTTELPHTSLCQSLLRSQTRTEGKQLKRNLLTPARSRIWVCTCSPVNTRYVLSTISFLCCLQYSGLGPRTSLKEATVGTHFARAMSTDQSSVVITLGESFIGEISPR
jgi:hypothetical protein